MTRVMVTDRRIEYTARVAPETAPVLTDYRGEEFRPFKLVATYWPDKGRARVQAIGWRTQHTSHRSATFNLQGYENYRPCPPWMVPIVRYVGYTEEIE